ncbi:hypothetical protein MLD38_031989 [Melastoma candidum]|uniref:Uncharacterized protein n=1 Tax=Melastoma candidum TaxID=119954 RepID=A0ACB9MSQ6_9MYRT|nr:hypothetical protein MLD38_031989 [Melastoma candidum]
MKMRSSSCGIDGCKPDRKTVERNRRIHMKGLCFKLSSLIPPHHHLHRSNKVTNQPTTPIPPPLLFVSLIRDKDKRVRHRFFGVC